MTTVIINSLNRLNSNEISSDSLFTFDWSVLDNCPYEVTWSLIKKKIYKKGLFFKIFDGYYSTINLISSALPKIGLMGATSGLTSDISSLNSGTLNNINSSLNVLPCMVTWTGYIYTGNNNGIWTFGAISDDSSYVWIDYDDADITIANSLINNGGEHGPQDRFSNKFLLAFSYYKIKIIYGQSSGGALMQFYWILPNTTIKLTDGTPYFFS